MTNEPIWIAEAPHGQWTSGPLVIHYPDTVERYREMGWKIEGPYVLQNEAAVLNHLKQQVSTLHENVKILEREAGEIRRWIFNRNESQNG